MRASATAGASRRRDRSRQTWQASSREVAMQPRRLRYRSRQRGISWLSPSPEERSILADAALGHGDILRVQLNTDVIAAKSQRDEAGRSGSIEGIENRARRHRRRARAGRLPAEGHGRNDRTEADVVIATLRLGAASELA